MSFLIGYWYEVSCLLIVVIEIMSVISYKLFVITKKESVITNTGKHFAMI